MIFYIKGTIELCSQVLKLFKLNFSDYFPLSRAAVLCNFTISSPAIFFNSF